jgi:hypothetical protein
MLQKWEIVDPAHSDPARAERTAIVRARQTFEDAGKRLLGRSGARQAYRRARYVTDASETDSGRSSCSLAVSFHSYVTPREIDTARVGDSIAGSTGRR